MPTASMTGVVLFSPVALRDGTWLVQGLVPGVEEVFVVVVDRLQVEVEAVFWSLVKWRENRIRCA